MSQTKKQALVEPTTKQASKKRCPTWAKVLIVIGSILVIAVIALAIIVPAVSRSVDTAKEEALQPFISALLDEDYAAAMDYVSSDANVDQNRLTALAGQSDLDSSCATEWTSFYIYRGTDGNYTDISGMLTCNNGKHSIEARLVKKDGTYKILHFRLLSIL